MKNRVSAENQRWRKERIDGPDANMKSKNKIKKNMKRLGGGGLSLEAFANAKTRSNYYNPALIKKQREFYKNAKYVRKYKSLTKQQSQQDNSVSSMKALEDDGVIPKDDQTNQRSKKNKKNCAQSLNELYETKRAEEEKARIEREATIQAKKEERERAEARRRSLREKMFKKTKSGQPVMKYRIEHMLETIQNLTT